MSPDNPVVVSNNAVATDNFRVEREVKQFASGPCKGKKFVNAFLCVVDTRRDNDEQVRGELSFLNVIPDESDDSVLSSHWNFQPSFSKDMLENLGPYVWSREDLIELAELMGKLQPESEIF